MRSRLTKVAMIGIVIVLATSVILACAPKAAPTPSPAPTPAPTPTPAPINLVMSSYLIYEMIDGYWPDAWANELEEMTNGRIMVKERHWGGSVTKANEVLPAAGSGAIDIGYLYSSYYPAELPLTQGLDIPLLTTNIAAQTRAVIKLYETYAPFTEEWEKKNNVKVMFFSPDAGATCMNRELFNKLEHFKGKKLRTFGPSAEILKAWGGTPVGVSFADIYTSLQTGVIDGAFATSFLAGSANKFMEVAPYYLDPGLGHFCTGAAVMNLDRYNSLPDDLRKIIDSLRSSFLVTAIDIQDRVVVETIEALKKEGEYFFHRLPAEELEKGIKLATPGIYDNWIAKEQANGLPAKELFDKYVQLIREYERDSTFRNWYDVAKELGLAD
ncbi:TRAP transporter substrate-binding protein DctP [Chloroflexota bacterium]